jgi:hypothetical protein
MKTFTAKLSLDGLELGLIVTALDENHSRFKLERSTGEKDPVILTRSGKRSWRVDNPGKWDISESAFKKFGRAIDTRLQKIAGMKVLLAGCLLPDPVPFL